MKFVKILFLFSSFWTHQARLTSCEQRQVEQKPCLLGISVAGIPLPARGTFQSFHFIFFPPEKFGI